MAKTYSKKLSSKRRLTNAGQLAPSCSPRSTSRSTKQDPKIESGYVFVVRTPSEADYRFVYRDGDYLSWAFYPRMIFPRVTEDLRTFWRRVVIDNLYLWDCAADHTTMRLVRFEASFMDVTFKDDYDETNLVRTLALSKLTAEEAKAIGKDREWFGMMMTRKEHSHQRERKLLDTITEDAQPWGIDSIKL